MPETRFELKKRATHELIKKAALELMLDSGLEGFSVDDAAARADVSRATLFNHFHTKEALIHEVAMPLFTQSMERIGGLLARSGAISVDDVSAFCLDLLRDHRERLGYSGTMAALKEYPSIVRLQGDFKSSFVRLMERVGETTPLRGGDPRLCADVLLGCFVPILSALGSRPDAERLFADFVTSLIAIG